MVKNIIIAGRVIIVLTLLVSVHTLLADDQHINPTAAVCYAFDGNDVQSTYLDGGANYYPAPESELVEALPEGRGYRIVVSTLFLYTGHATFLPLVHGD
jgi:hypothetical protein